MVLAGNARVRAHIFFDKYMAGAFEVETNLYNRIVLGSLLPEGAREALPHWTQGWLRNYIGGTLVYFISSFLWCFYIYYLKRNLYIPKGHYFISFLVTFF